MAEGPHDLGLHGIGVKNPNEKFQDLSHRPNVGTKDLGLADVVITDAATQERFVVVTQEGQPLSAQLMSRPLAENFIMSLPEDQRVGVSIQTVTLGGQQVLLG